MDISLYEKALRFSWASREFALLHLIENSTDFGEPPSAQGKLWYARCTLTLTLSHAAREHICPVAIPVVIFLTPLSSNSEIKRIDRPTFLLLAPYWRERSSQHLPFCSTRGFRPHWAGLRTPALSFDRCKVPYFIIFLENYCDQIFRINLEVALVKVINVGNHQLM